MDSDIEAARPWVDEAAPQYTVLIDQHHVLSGLYNMVNVPQAVWIDEDGRIARPTETGGSADILRDFDFEIGNFTPEALQKAQHSKATYMAAVEDWARNGKDSPYVYAPDQARAKVPDMTEDQALAHTLFRLGTCLQQNGRQAEAQALFARCRELHPQSWNIFRQTTDKLENGIAASEQYWQKIAALGDEPYYHAIDLPGIDHDS